ncbi:MAG: transporter substrate-binding protein [Frankiales bacterium]|nr:transporter substrate-binding protein [Frankiales bacterium]
MITRSVKLQLLVFALISLTGMAFAGARYADLDRFFTDQGYVVAADFDDSGGIFTGAEVTYRGVPAGEVSELELLPDGVRVKMLLRPGTKVPSEVKAAVGNRSAVGEQYVDLLPQRDGAPFMKTGDVIPKSETTIPIQPTELLVNLDDFVKSIDTDDLAVVLDELGAAFDDGTGESLQRLVDAGDQLTAAATEALPETIALIRDGNTVLDTQNQTSGQFRSFNRDLRSLTQQLRTSDPDFRALYAGGTGSANEVQDVLEANRTALPVLIDNLVSTAQVQQVRLPQLRQILVTYPNVIAGGFTVTPGDGTAHFGFVTDSAVPVCTQGYETTDRRLPSETSNPTPNLAAYCADDDGPSSVRGARNSEYPKGSAPFPENRGVQADKAAKPGAAAATASSSSARGSGSASAPAARSSAPGTRQLDPVTLGDYDPKTGNVITQDGKTLQIGSTAGAQKLFGSRSWEWMLLGPLAGS